MYFGRYIDALWCISVEFGVFRCLHWPHFSSSESSKRHIGTLATPIFTVGRRWLLFISALTGDVTPRAMENLENYHYRRAGFFNTRCRRDGVLQNCFRKKTGNIITFIVFLYITATSYVWRWEGCQPDRRQTSGWLVTARQTKQRGGLVETKSLWRKLYTYATIDTCIMHA